MRTHGVLIEELRYSLLARTMHCVLIKSVQDCLATRIHTCNSLQDTCLRLVKIQSGWPTKVTLEEQMRVVIPGSVI